jgi:alpha-L-fucosidase
VRNILFSALFDLILTGCAPGSGPILPSPGQIAYQEMEMVGFIHFSMNTFTDKEWGFGDEDPGWFNPAELDAEQWVITAREGGLQELILTAKHHDGFCLWPSAYTEHCIKNSPYREGRGDIVREFVDACRKHGLKAGLYLSPWDRNNTDYGKPEYITYYRNQLRELLTGYGEINEIWFDGANGGDGYYGGANCERRVDKRTYYDWPATFELVRELQPGIKIFSDAGPDIRWVGNENGFAGETFWSVIDTGQLVIGDSDQAYLNRGDPLGNKWIIGQCDVSIRPGWFYHASQDSLVKSPQELVDIFYKSVGRNGVLLLNLPPDRRGLIHEIDAASIREFREIIGETFRDDLADGAGITVVDRGSMSMEMIIALGNPGTFDRIMLQEPIEKGQRISRFHVEAETAPGRWKKVAGGTTVGYKRIVKIDPTTASNIRVVVDSAFYEPFLKRVGLFRSSPREQ